LSEQNIRNSHMTKLFSAFAALVSSGLLFTAPFA
jgi:hypothetical protein